MACSNIRRSASPILNLSENVLSVGGVFVSTEWYGAVQKSVIELCLC